MSVNDLLSPRVTESVEGVQKSIDVRGKTDVFDVLANEASRAIIVALRESPRTASEIATEIGHSIQSTSYHLDRLQSVGLIHIVGTRYSSKAREMDVYGLASESVVVHLGESRIHSSKASIGPEDY